MGIISDASTLLYRHANHNKQMPVAFTLQPYERMRVGGVRVRTQRCEVPASHRPLVGAHPLDMTPAKSCDR